MQSCFCCGHTDTNGDTQWRDLLTKVDGNAITYDASGNPTSYYNGYTMTWVEGRRLKSVTTTAGKYTYEYNSDGQRTKRTTPDGSYIEYYVVNGVTVGESHYTASGSKTKGIRYTLDENNSVIGFTTGGVNYYFTKNLQGDVLAVYNASTDEVVAQYTYDSWGSILTATGGMKDTNPFRYRGYYYDGETGLYYLQSRYYDAGIGRFINADALFSTGQGVLGNNMVSFCLNNPINLSDQSGYAAVHREDPSHTHYIYNQHNDSYATLSFGLANISHSGCGVVAAYNTMKILGRNDTSIERIISYYESTDNLPIGGLLGTSPYALESNLINEGYNVFMTKDVNTYAPLVEIADACIIWYMYHSDEFPYVGAHFVAFNQTNGIGRYYNLYSNTNYPHVFNGTCDELLSNHGYYNAVLYFIFCE